jgi:hypothetical protein
MVSTFSQWFRESFSFKSWSQLFKRNERDIKTRPVLSAVAARPNSMFPLGAEFNLMDDSGESCRNPVPPRAEATCQEHVYRTSLR